ncbi:MAG: hypothetical protein JW783_01395 [Bacteroidales bacterium]|nr:hypothetical protein [Bacteroidales bacterium]
MKGIPVETKNKKLDDLFLAVYFNDLKKVIEFKNQFPELYAKKNKYRIDENTTLDLTNLTYFNQIIWFDEDWTDNIKPLVEKYRQRTEKMLNFWNAELSPQEINRKIEYNSYCDLFYCDDPNDPDNNERILLDTITYFIKRGFREVDLRLYNRVECFDFAEVENLLKQGAKTNIHFYEDDDSSTFSRISSEVSFLATCQVVPEFKIFETKGYNQNFNIATMFANLLALAAHQEMYHLLNEYDKEK